RVRAVADLLAQQVGDLQVARPPRRAESRPVAVFLVGGVRGFGHNSGARDEGPGRIALASRITMNADTIAKSEALDGWQLRGATLCQPLHWLASGRVDATQLCEAHLAAISADNPRLNAYVHVAAGARDEARAAAARRAAGVFGRLDGVPVSVKDNLDV